jgi:hypothetical protein
VGKVTSSASVQYCTCCMLLLLQDISFKAVLFHCDSLHLNYISKFNLSHTCHAFVAAQLGHPPVPSIRCLPPAYTGLNLDGKG